MQSNAKNPYFCLIPKGECYDGLDMRVLDEDDYEVELRDLDEGEDDDVMHVDDLEKARVQQAKEAAELEKAKEEASDKTE